MKSLTAVSLLAMAAMAAALFFALERNSPAAAPGGGAGAGGGGGGGRAGRGGAAAPAAPVPLTLTTIVPDGKPHVFAAKNKTFSIDGQPTILIAGEMHFGRILPEDFETRVKQAKAMGLNAISFYLFWNLSEPEEGKFDFTGMNDVHRMLKICQENGMWAVLRPGPYCCAEVDYGGIPYWTATGDNENVKIRSTDPKYLAWEKRYIDRLGQEIGDMQVTKGGPLLMVQLENEFGMVAGVPGTGGYDAVKSLTPIFKGAGFNVPFYVCDPGSIGGRGGTNPYGDDILRAPNGMSGGGGAEATYQRNLAASGDFPLYSPEVYT
ncbi:MAG TPA: beta-galactosidase, partial [Phycisphaerae bacterium]